MKNGHISHGTNGNGQKKPHHKGITTKLLKATAVKHDGSPTKVAKALGIAEPTAHKHLQKPEIKQAVLSEREKALKRVGLTRDKAYRPVVAALDAKVISWGKETKAPDHKRRLEASKLAAQLLGDLEETKEGGLNIANIFNFYVPTKKPIQKIVEAFTNGKPVDSTA